MEFSNILHWLQRRIGFTCMNYIPIILSWRNNIFLIRWLYLVNKAYSMFHYLSQVWNQRISSIEDPGIDRFVYQMCDSLVNPQSSRTRHLKASSGTLWIRPWFRPCRKYLNAIWNKWKTNHFWLMNSINSYIRMWFFIRYILSRK